MKNVVSTPAVLSAQIYRPCVFTMSFVIGRPRSTPRSLDSDDLEKDACSCLRGRVCVENADAAQSNGRSPPWHFASKLSSGPWAIVGRVPRGTVRLCSTRYVNNVTNASAIEHFADMEVMEAIWVASEMRAGGAYAHSNLAIDTMKRVEARRGAAKATDAT